MFDFLQIRFLEKSARLRRYMKLVLEKLFRLLLADLMVISSLSFYFFCLFGMCYGAGN